MSIDLKGKTYLELNHTEPMTIEEIERLYDGFWVYVVKAEFKVETRTLINGIPAVIAVSPFAGVKEGIYKKYKAKEYSPQKELFLLDDNFVSALVSVGV